MTARSLQLIKAQKRSPAEAQRCGEMQELNRQIAKAPNSRRYVTAGCCCSPRPPREMVLQWFSTACLALAIALLSSCASSSKLNLRSGSGSPDTIALQPVQNLAGVSLRVPELYVADMLDRGSPIEIELIDLRLVSEAALLGALRAGHYQLAENAKFRLYPAITEYEATTLRKSGRYKMALALIVVDVATNTEVARGGAAREFQLFEEGPEERGVLGHERFVRRRLESFTETLALEALANLGLQ